MIESLILIGAISWYGTGTKGMYTACYRQYRYRTFQVTYKGKSIKVKCNDSGGFETNGSGRVLDLSKEAFSKLAPTRQGIIRGAKIELLPTIPTNSSHSPSSSPAILCKLKA